MLRQSSLESSRIRKYSDQLNDSTHCAFDSYSTCFTSKQMVVDDELPLNAEPQSSAQGVAVQPALSLRRPPPRPRASLGDASYTHHCQRSLLRQRAQWQPPPASPVAAFRTPPLAPSSPTTRTAHRQRLPPGTAAASQTTAPSTLCRTQAPRSRAAAKSHTTLATSRMRMRTGGRAAAHPSLPSWRRSCYWA